VLACAPSAAIFLVRDPSVLEQCPASEHPHHRFGAKSDHSEREDGWTQGGMRWAGLARYVRSQCLPHLPSLSPSTLAVSIAHSFETNVRTRAPIQGEMHSRRACWAGAALGATSKVVYRRPLRGDEYLESRLHEPPRPALRPCPTTILRAQVDSNTVGI
jgi:hypothetical protein